MTPGRTKATQFSNTDGRRKKKKYCSSTTSMGGKQLLDIYHVLFILLTLNCAPGINPPPKEFNKVYNTAKCTKEFKQSMKNVFSDAHRVLLAKYS